MLAYGLANNNLVCKGFYVLHNMASTAISKITEPIGYVILSSNNFEQYSFSFLILLAIKHENNNQ